VAKKGQFAKRKEKEKTDPGYIISTRKETTAIVQAVVRRGENTGGGTNIIHNDGVKNLRGGEKTSISQRITGKEKKSHFFKEERGVKVPEWHTSFEGVILFPANLGEKEPALRRKRVSGQIIKRR